MTHHDQELTTGERTRMLTAGVMRLSPVALTGIACAEIIAADAADLYAACSEVAPKLREVRR